MAESQIARVWAEIEAITPPEPIFAAPGSELELAPTVTGGSRSKVVPWVVWAVTVLGAAAVLYWFTSWWWAAALVALGVLGWWIYYNEITRRQLTERRAALDAAAKVHAELVRQADALGPPGFAALVADLQALRTEYDVEIPRRERSTLAAFESAAQQRQLQRHLGDAWITNASIPGLGAARKGVLLVAGIRTAADVNPASIHNLPSFGQKLTEAIVAWRDERVREFRYDPTDQTTRQEREQALEPHRERRRELEAQLVRGRDQLRRLSRLPGDQRGELAQRLAEASRDLAQAHLDLSTT